MDLRRRVAGAVENREGSLRQLARRFRVSVPFITRPLRLRRQTGSLAPRPHGGGHRPAPDEAGLQRLRQLLQERPDATPEELAQGLGCGRMAAWRTLRKLRITRKKKLRRADERGRPDVEQKRQAFCAELADIDPNRLVFVGEMGATTAMARTYGRAPKGGRAYGSVPGRWQSMTLISGMRLGGVWAAWAFAGATDAAGFQTYAEAVLAPELRAGDVVIWDNLKPHKSEEAIEAVEAAGADVVPLPPYSPDLTPIEEMFSKVKGAMRSAAGRTKEAVYEAFGSALHDVTPENIAGWFRDRAAYAMQL